MTRNTWIAAVVALAVIAAVAVGIAVMAGDDHGDMMDDDRGAHGAGMMMDGTSMGPDGMMSMDPRTFIEMMIPHHQGAVDMARIQVRRGSDPETTALARRIIADQEQEIAQMRAWYRDWYGRDVPAVSAGAMAQMGMHTGTGDLATTEEPDRAFLRMMLPHHASAITMSDMLLNGRPREEIAGLARGIIAAQATEIGQMQAMRARIAPPLG